MFNTVCVKVVSCNQSANHPPRARLLRDRQYAYTKFRTRHYPPPLHVRNTRRRHCCQGGLRAGMLVGREEGRHSLLNGTMYPTANFCPSRQVRGALQGDGQAIRWPITNEEAVWSAILWSAGQQ